MREQRAYISLTELQNLISSTLAKSVPTSIWVTAEIADVKFNRHCYLELVEKSSSDENNNTATASMRATIWNSTCYKILPKFEEQTGQKLQEGLKILVCGNVSNHPLYGISFNITAIDPTYTLGDIEQQRQATIAKLKQEGIWDYNRELDMPIVAQNIAVISSPKAAGYGDFCNELARSPYIINTTLFEATMQGKECEGSIIAALNEILERQTEFDAVVIIRGGGSTNDLQCYNLYNLAAYVAQFPLPIISGIGHDRDVSIVDMVAHTPLKTPTAVAQWLYNRSAEFDGVLENLSLQLKDLCSTYCSNEKLRLQQVSNELEREVKMVLLNNKKSLESYTTLLLHSCKNYIDNQKKSINYDAELLQKGVITTLSMAKQKLDSLTMVIDTYSPKNLLNLGLSIVRIGNKSIRSVDSVAVGQNVEIILTDGKLDAQIKNKIYGTRK